MWTLQDAIKLRLGQLAYFARRLKDHGDLSNATQLSLAKVLVEVDGMLTSLEELANQVAPRDAAASERVKQDPFLDGWYCEPDYDPPHQNLLRDERHHRNGFRWDED
jgi:hypothetical protein